MKPASVFTALAVLWFSSAPVSAVDTDGDGFDDAVEEAEGSDPNNGDITPLDTALADSVTDFSGAQGQDGWFYGYRNYTSDGGATHYDPETAFIPFERDGTDVFKADANHWNGSSWDLQDQAAGPWTQIEPDRGHPNGINSAPNEEHWAIRRWVAQIPGPIPVAIGWNLASANAAGGGTAGSLHINGQRVDFAKIAGNDEVGIYRTYYAHLRPGDVVDIALTPEDMDGQRTDASDATIFGLRINSRFPLNPIQPSGASFNPQSLPLADSRTDWSTTGTQGENQWTYGYRDYTNDGGALDYDPRTEAEGGNFIPFPEEWWTGVVWDNPGAVNPPWTEIGAEYTHPNSAGNGGEHWTIRRWEPLLVDPMPMAFTWHIAASNITCGDGTGGSVHINGVAVDGAVVGGTDGTGITRTVYALVRPGDVVDLALTPEDETGGREDACDGSVNWLQVTSAIPADAQQPDGTAFVPDYEETDSDGDGFPDEWETIYADDLTVLTADGDADGDGLSDADEFAAFTHPLNRDSDGDHLPDGAETGTGSFVSADDTGTFPTLLDSDGDGLTDGQEVLGTPLTDPSNPDSDGDGLTDGEERDLGTDPTDPSSNRDAFVIAHSMEEFSGEQGQDGWFHGYRNYTLDGGAVDYDPNEDFIPFLNDDSGVLNPGTNHWNGASWVLQEGGSPWTTFAAESGHPNGTNSAPGEEHWAVRRWAAEEIETVTPLAIRWNVRAENLAGGGTGGSLHLDGRRIDMAVVAGTDGEGVTRTVYANVRPGAVIDLGLTPEDLNGGRGDGSDGSLFWMEISTLIPSDPRQPDGTLFVPEGGDDSDADLLPDGWEQIYFPADLTQLTGDQDYDTDGLTDREEFEMETDPTVADTDEDGLLDGVETGTGTFVGASDTGTNPLLADTDGDGLIDGDELPLGTNPNLGDTDGDGFSDGEEVAAGTDPLDSTDDPFSTLIAESVGEFSGEQGQDGWYYGYRNYTQDGGATDYDPEEHFIEFLNDGTNVVTETTNHWTGSAWDLPGDGPWTNLGAESAHPNGTNSAPNEEHWVIRRWVADELDGETALALHWHLRATNLGGGGGTGGSLHINGIQVDAEVIGGTDGTGVTRTFYANLHPGDVVDLALTPEDLNGGRGDGSDGSAFWMRVDERIPESPLQPDGTPFIPVEPEDPNLSVPRGRLFGELPPGTTQEQVMVTLRNTGATLPLTITNVEIVGADASLYTLGSWPDSLNAGEVAEVPITFSPQGRDGGFIAFLEVTSSDPSQPTQTVDLSAQIPNANRLLVHYRLDESEGTQALDQSGAAIHGVYTLQNGSLTLGSPALASGSAITVGGGDQASGYVSIPARSLDPLESFSFSIWFERDPSDTGIPVVLVSKGAGTGEFALAVTANSTLGWLIDGGTQLEVADAFTSGTPHHLVLVYDVSEGGDSDVIIYINGVEVDRLEGGTPLDDAARSEIQIGALDGNFGFNGVLDDFQLYGKALTPEEVGYLQENPGQALASGGVDPGLLDSDNDGQSDAEEEIAGTDPQDAASYLRVMSTVRSATGVQLNWASVSGKSYRIYYSTTMESPDWIEIGTAEGADGMTSFEDTDADRLSGSEGYYRVETD